MQPCPTVSVLMISLGRNPLTGLNPLQLGAVREDSRGLRILVAIPLRGSIPCNSRSTGRLSVPLCERVAIPLRGSIPCNEGQKALEEARGAESQSPYGAQSLATQGREGAPRVLLPLGSQSPYGAQSLATLGRFEAGGEEGPAVAIPLRGSIPCNPEVNPLPPPLPGVVAIPLRGSIPCNPEVNPLPPPLPGVVAIPLRGSIPCNPEVNPLPPPLPGVVAIPLRGSIPCN